MRNYDDDLTMFQHMQGYARHVDRDREALRSRLAMMGHAGQLTRHAPSNPRRTVDEVELTAILCGAIIIGLGLGWYLFGVLGLFAVGG